MLRKLFRSVREFKKPTILTLIFIVGEAIIETLIPFITADLVNKIKIGEPLRVVIITGVSLAAMACVSLLCGGIAGGDHWPSCLLASHLAWRI